MLLDSYYSKNKYEINDKIFDSGLSKKLIGTILELDTIENFPYDAINFIINKDFCLRRVDVAALCSAILVKHNNEELAEKVYNSFRNNVYTNIMDFCTFKSRSYLFGQYLELAEYKFNNKQLCGMSKNTSQKTLDDFIK